MSTTMTKFQILRTEFERDVERHRKAVDKFADKLRASEFPWHEFEWADGAVMASARMWAATWVLGLFVRDDDEPLTEDEILAEIADRIKDEIVAMCHGGTTSSAMTREVERCKRDALRTALRHF